MVKSEAYLKLFELMRKDVYRYSSEPFILASGKQSNHYFNCKEITLHPDRLSILASYLVKEHIPSFLLTTPKSVGGLTLGADPISYAISLAYYQNEKIVYPLVVRKEAKGHGTGKKIEGVGNQKSCLVVDDVITTGGSTIQAVESLREAGIKVEQGICILDREEGGYEALFEKGIKMFPIFRKSDFI
ncbi:MAG: orotate phosphoribosyltransferase [Leptospiraceae bacterium]|nr:orotate phosphoribosyltransferase [Leptospiraceae bacterium]